MATLLEKKPVPTMQLAPLADKKNTKIVADRKAHV